MFNSQYRYIINTLMVIISAFAVSTIVHILLDKLFSFENSIISEPNILYLMLLLVFQITLFVIAYNLIKEKLPYREDWKKGLFFTSLFLFAVQVPSILGIMAYEPNSEWQFLTQKKIANYITLFGDIITFSVIGILLGKLFPSKETAKYQFPKLGYASIFCSIIFPVLLFAVMRLFYSFVHINDVHAPIQDSFWFNLIFYGIFFMTGYCLPIFHNIVKQNTSGGRVKKIFYSTLIFCLLWLPVQNFMVVFGWDFAGGFVFSLVSIIPIFLTILISDYYIKDIK